MEKNINGRVRPLVLALILLIGGIAHEYWWMWGLGLIIIILLIAEAIFYARNTRPLD